MAILVAVVSLIVGASLGPEAPLGRAVGAAGTWLARRKGGDETEVRTATFTGMSGMFGGEADFVLARAILMAAFNSFAVRLALTETVSEVAVQVASGGGS